MLHFDNRVSEYSFIDFHAPTPLVFTGSSDLGLERNYNNINSNSVLGPHMFLINIYCLNIHFWLTNILQTKCLAQNVGQTQKCFRLKLLRAV